MSKSIKLLGLSILFASLLHGCARTQESFLLVEMCVVDKRGVVQFKSVMRDIAKLEKLKFIDNSAQQGNDLRAMGADKLLKRDASLPLMFTLKGREAWALPPATLAYRPIKLL